MHVLSGLELLECWEKGLEQSPARRALTLLVAACTDTSPEVLANLSIGQRDGSLLQLRESTFGPKIEGVTNCPECKKQLELTFNIADIRVNSEIGPDETLSLNVDDYELRFRLPNSMDMEALAVGNELINNRLLLLERCLLDIQSEDKEKSVDQLPEQVIEKVVEKMAGADPQANVQLALSCSSCGHQWSLAFDIVSFFWNEIKAWAHRILREVHILASAYGWKETDILTMSPMRRHIYLGMASK